MIPKNSPHISVLFSTFNRGLLLREVLQSLTLQNLPPDQFEVVVVDDGSTDATGQIVAGFASRLRVEYVRQENCGLAIGRNRAISLAEGPIVLFMDDDDVADSNLLDQHLHMHAEHPEENAAVLGFTDLREDLASNPLMYFVNEVGYYLFRYLKLEHGQVLNYTYFWGGRTSCKRSFLTKYGMFDPIFKFGCEDIELGYRLSSHGLRVVYNKNARSTMIRGFSLEEFCHREELKGRSNWIFSRKHRTPEVESWTEIASLGARWEYFEPRLGHFKKIAAELDKVAQLRLKYKLDIDELLISLLHHAYWMVIDGHRARGSWMARQEQELNDKAALTQNQERSRA